MSDELITLPRLPRQLNVQQQNKRSTDALRATAVYWRVNGVPPLLRAVATAQGVDWNFAIILDLAIDFPGMPRLFGELLTQHYLG